MHVFEVGQVTLYIRQIVEGDELLADVWIHGEVANLSRAASGHIYFGLKEGQAQLKCVLFRSHQRGLAEELVNGLSILAHGRISFYEAQSTCQLVVDSVQPEGVGLLYLQFEALRAKLEGEGLFAPERKRKLPRYPRRIGLVTSPTGAAIHDFLTIVGRRYPLVEIVVTPSAVQGDSAPMEVVAAIEALNHDHRTARPLDAIVIARGGGSAEDLAAFNHEGLARAIFASTVPIVSAIGHETDFTIADYVADLRAPTPSAAAELVTPNVSELGLQIGELGRRLVRNAQEKLAASNAALERAQRQLDRHSPGVIIGTHRRALDAGMARGQTALVHRLKLARAQVGALRLQLEALSPLKTLDRGYAICFDRTKNGLVRSYRAVDAGDQLEIRVADGSLRSVACDTDVELSG